MSVVTTIDSPRKPTRLGLLSRIAAGVLGSYVFVWGFIMLVTTLAATAGMPFGDAQTLAYLLAFLVFVVCFCWAFAARSVLRVWLVLAAGGAVMTGLGWLCAGAVH